jgi:hypothetical protein
MDLILGLALRAGLLVYCFVVPGAAILRAVGFVTRSHLDYVLACLAAGAAATSLTVTTLLLAGLYYRPVAATLLIVPLAYLAWTSTRARPIRASLTTPPGPAEGRADHLYIDRAVIVAAAAFLAVYLLDAWTSPITWWDGLASWGKWAADWGRRTSSAHYVVGGYPQLVPRIVSVMYKMTGAHSDILPLDFFALHGVYVLCAIWFLLAAVRVARLLDLPAWPVLLVGLGSGQFREHSGAGTVDVLVSALVLTSIALYFGLRRGEWTARRQGLVLGAALFAAIFTKWTGGIALPVLLLIDRGARAYTPFPPERDAVQSRTLRYAIAVAAVGMMPFLIEQGIAEARIHHWRPDPFEVNISARQIPGLLSTDANLVYRGGTPAVRAELVQLRFWNSYDVPASLRLIFTVFLAACLAGSVRSWFGRAVLPLVIVYGVIWLYWSSYDQRNIFGILPLVALCASYGAATLWHLRPRFVFANGVTVLAGLFLLLSAGGMLKEMQSRIAAMSRGPSALPLRLDAMRGTVADKVARFYGHLNDDYRFIAELSERTGAAHVLVTTPLFRFLERGAHGMSRWPFELIRPGDIFATHEWLMPPPDERWTLVYRGSTHKVWVLVAEWQPVEATRVLRNPTAGREGAGEVTQALYAVRPSDVSDGGYVVWRATLPGDSGNGAATFTSAGPLSFGSPPPSTACEQPNGRAGAYRCSGIVTLSGDSSRRLQTGQLEVGATTDASRDGVTLALGRTAPAPDTRR